jgi:hypothetical protein
MTEEMIQERMDEIMTEFSLLPQLKDYDLTLEAVGEDGDVKATLRKDENTFEKTFGITDDLRGISATFGYGEYLTPTTCDLSLNGLKMVYFNEFGAVVTIRKDTTEVFRIKDAQRERIKIILKEKLGKLFHE